MTFREELTEKFNAISNQLSPEQSDAALNELLDFINTRFATPTDAAAISKMQDEVDFFVDADDPKLRYLHEIPDQFSDLTISIYAFWLLVSVQKVVFRPQNVPAFNEFADKFSNIIIR